MMKTYATVNPGSAAAAVQAIITPVAWVSASLPYLQALSFLVSIISGLVALFYFLKRRT